MEHTTRLKNVFRNAITFIASVIIIFTIFLLVGNISTQKNNKIYNDIVKDIQSQHYVSDCDNIDVEVVNLKSIDLNEKIGSCSNIETFKGFESYINCVDDDELITELEKKYNRQYFDEGNSVTIMCTGYEDLDVSRVVNIDFKGTSCTIVKEIGNIGVNMKVKNKNAVFHIISFKKGEVQPTGYSITYRTSDLENLKRSLNSVELSNTFWSLNGLIKRNY